jgi:hypothetical protein
VESEFLFVYDLDLPVEHLPRKPVNRHMHPVTLLAFDEEVRQALQFRGEMLVSLHWVALRLCFLMSLAEIEKAVDELSPKELTKLAAYITRRNKLAWDQEIEEDFSPGGKHEKTLEKIDAEIDSGNFTPLP